MRYPTSDDVAGLRGKRSTWYELWLRVGLEEYFFEAKGREAFSEVANFIDQPDGSIASDLKLLAEALPARDLATFRDAVSQTLQGLDFADDKEARIAHALLDLGASIRSPDLLRIVTQKAFTIRAGHDSIRVYDLALNVAEQLADLDPVGCVLCVKHLVSQEQLFQSAVAGRALIAMTKAQPRQFPAHYRFLRDHLEADYGFLPRNDIEDAARVGRRSQLIRKLIRLVPQRSLLAIPCRPEMPDRPEVGNWWMRTLSDLFPALVGELESSLGELAATDLSYLPLRATDRTPHNDNVPEALRLGLTDLGLTEPLVPADVIDENDAAELELA